LCNRPLDRACKAVLMTAGWMINIVVAEWVIRRRPVSSRRPAASTNALTGQAGRYAIASGTR
jgi:hypothetical protein